MTMTREKNLSPLGFLTASLLLGAWAVAASAAEPRPAGSGTAPAEQAPPERPGANQAPAPAIEAASVRSTLAGLSKDASAADLGRALQSLLPQLFRANSEDLPALTETLAALSQQPRIVAAFAESYKQLRPEALQERLLTLGMVGELRRPDAIPFLKEVVWTPLPAKEGSGERLSPREIEEMVQVKAVEGIAFVATADADAAAKEVMLKHPSTHVRATAIDAYMWNHGDSAEAAKELYALLPSELHPYVERPRFHPGMDAKAFAERLGAWQAKWASAKP